MKYLELNAEGVVTNIIIWDGVSPYEPPGVAQLLPCSQHPGVGYGWKRVANNWQAPLPAVVVVPSEDAPE